MGSSYLHEDMCLEFSPGIIVVQLLSCVWLFVTPWTVASRLLCLATNGILQQQYWSVLPFPSPGPLPEPGMEPRSPALQADSLLSEPIDQGSP